MTLCVGSGGCTGGERAADNAVPQPLFQTQKRGPVTLTLGAASGSPAISDRLEVTLEVVAEPNVTVDVPDYGEALRKQPFGFEVTDGEQVTAEPREDGLRLWRRQYSIDFLIPGEHTLPGARISYVDERQAKPDEVGSAETVIKPQTLETEPITLNVSAGAELEYSPEELAKIKMPAPRELVESPQAARSRWGLMAAGAAAAAIVAFLALRFLRRPRSAAEIVVPPDEWALAELTRLLNERLVQARQVQEFYYRLSGIVRVYVERRFDLHVPEMTTEEFLNAALAGKLLGALMKASLGEFLEACDRVKFALYEPKEAEVNEAVEAARGFVEKTHTVDRQDATTGTGGQAASGTP